MVCLKRVELALFVIVLRLSPARLVSSSLLPANVTGFFGCRLRRSDRLIVGGTYQLMTNACWWRSSHPMLLSAALCLQSLQSLTA